jgi:hypothetical protein
MIGTQKNTQKPLLTLTSLLLRIEHTAPKCAKEATKTLKSYQGLKHRRRRWSQSKYFGRDNSI